MCDFKMGKFNSFMWIGQLFAKVPWPKGTWNRSIVDLMCNVYIYIHAVLFYLCKQCIDSLLSLAGCSSGHDMTKPVPMSFCFESFLTCIFQLVLSQENMQSISHIVLIVAYTCITTFHMYIGGFPIKTCCPKATTYLEPWIMWASILLESSTETERGGLKK